MKILYTKANWERSELSVREFVQLCVDSGYDATEIYLPARIESTKEIRELHESVGLSMVSHIATEGKTVKDHLRSLERHYLRALELRPLFVNSHTGKDYFSRADSLQIFAAGERLVEEYGIPLLHETHRGRALFSASATQFYLREIPSLRLTADFSHWVCVHESDLSDQPEALDAASQSAQHIHARIGFDQGPQISDPRNPAQAFWLDRFLHWWQAIVDLRRAEGREWLTITPEFGPSPYMPLSGASPEPIGDAWEYNRWMHQYLRKNLSIDQPTSS